MVLGCIQARWPSFVPPPHFEAVEWCALVQGSRLLAPVEAQPLQSCPPWPHAVALGSLPPNWSPSLQASYPVPKLSGPMEARALILALVAAEPLLQASPLVLDQPLQARWPPPIPLPYLPALDWSPLGYQAWILGTVPQEPL